MQSNEKFLKKSKREFCEGCMVLGLTPPGGDGCILCSGTNTTKDIARNRPRIQNAINDPIIGDYLACIDAVSDKYQKASSAGGFVTSVLDQLLETGLVTGIISVAFDASGKEFRYRLFTDTAELASQQRSSYYPVRLNEALEIIRKKPGRYVITGIPAAVKALEIIRRQDKVVNERLAFVIGLVSGGVKTKDYLDYLLKKSGKQDGLNKVTDISFRDKADDNYYHGSNYYFTARSGGELYRLKSGKIPYNWAAGLLKEFSSDFCDDTFNILADMTVMDGWLKRYENTNGVSLAIVRNQQLLDAIYSNRDLTVNTVQTSDIIQSQRGGLSHKTLGLKARMKIFSWAGNQLPVKDVPNSPINPIILIEQFLRLRSAYVSRVLYKKYRDDRVIDKRLKKYVVALKIINKVKHKLGQ